MLHSYASICGIATRSSYILDDRASVCVTCARFGRYLRSVYTRTVIFVSRCVARRRDATSLEIGRNPVSVSPVACRFVSRDTKIVVRVNRPKYWYVLDFEIVFHVIFDKNVLLHKCNMI
jgi:hypothetical protein